MSTGASHQIVEASPACPPPSPKGQSSDVKLSPIALEVLSDLGRVSHLCLELCAGVALLSLTLGASGFQAVAVDQQRNRHQAHVPVTVLDLTILEHQHVLFLFCIVPRFL